jgi:hypothetical protein
MEPGKKPAVTLAKLQKAVPAFDWSKGHSGALLPEEVAAQIGELCENEEKYAVKPKEEYLN